MNLEPTLSEGLLRTPDDPNPTETLGQISTEYQDLQARLAAYQARLDTNPLTLPLALGYAQMHHLTINRQQPILITPEGHCVLNVLEPADSLGATHPKTLPNLPECCQGLELDQNGYPALTELRDLLKKRGIDATDFGRDKKAMLARLS